MAKSESGEHAGSVPTDGNDSDGSITVIREERSNSDFGSEMINMLQGDEDSQRETSVSEDQIETDLDIEHSPKKRSHASMEGEGSDYDDDDDDLEVTNMNKRRNADLTPETINLEAEEQQVVEIPDEEANDEESKKREYKRVRDYKCPICFEPPDVAIMTPCGHVFCCECLFQMVNNSRTPRKGGVCALCRKTINMKQIKMLVLRKVQKKT